MNEPISWAKDPRFYEKLWVVVDMNDSGSLGQALDVMNNSKLWLTRTTPSRELRALDDMNNSELLMT